MTTNIRRRRINYLLPSESTELLGRMVGKRISGFRLGSRYSSIDDLVKRKMIKDPSDLVYKSSGGPFIFSFADASTVIFYNDDFLGSIVLREVALGIEDQRFFDALELEDRLGERIKIRHGFDLSGQCGILNQDIMSISVYKLPENFYYKPIGYDLQGECVVCLKLSSFGDLVLAGEIHGGSEPADIRVVKWESLDKSAVDQLACIWSSTSFAPEV